MQIFIYILIITLIGTPAPALGEQPLEALQRGIDKGIRILEDPQYQDASRRNEQAQKLWEVTLEVFDFKEFSQAGAGIALEKIYLSAERRIR